MQSDVIIIDGNSLMYRAFYALPLLQNARGEYTNAVFGFLNMFMKVLELFSPRFAVVALDEKGPTFRHKHFDAYKAGRRETPDELVPQMTLLRDVMDALGVWVVSLSGYEADDILGTLSREAQEKGLRVALVTGDRDALQLVSELTSVCLTKKGLAETELFTPEHLREVYGFLPAQIVDLKALMGDASDNIPGVAGVGEKTAMKLLAQYQTVQGVYDHLEDIAGKLQEKLRDGRDNAMMSYALATIDTHVPVAWDEQAASFALKRTAKLEQRMSELGFQTILKRFADLPYDEEDSGASPDEAAYASEATVVRIDDAASLRGALDALADGVPVAWCVDGRAVSFSVSADVQHDVPVKATLIDDGMGEDEVWMAAKAYWEDEKKPKVVHDAKRWMHALSRFHVRARGIVFDTMIAAYLVNALAAESTLEQAVAAYVPRAGNGARAVWALQARLADMLRENEMQALFRDMEMPLTGVLYRMEEAGFAVDMEELTVLRDQFRARIATLQEEIYALCGETFNINSTKQLGVVLFEKLGLPSARKTKTGYSTDAEVLENLRGHHLVIEKILLFRQLVKLNGTYADGLLPLIRSDGRIHTHFHQAVAATGRLSSSDPNMQNIPIRTDVGREIRRVFHATDEQHVLIDADYSQIELRILAHMSQDPAMLSAFQNGEDIHRRTAANVFGVAMEDVTPQMRASAKAVNFGIIYGISDFGLSRNIGISRKEAAAFIDTYLARYPGVKRYMEESVRLAKENGYAKTLFGRRRSMPELTSNQYTVRQFGERVAMNMPIQGTAADVIKLAMVRIDERLRQEGFRARLILQVHDELIIDAPIEEEEAACAMLKETMESVVSFSVLLEADVHSAHSWFEAH